MRLFMIKENYAVLSKTLLNFSTTLALMARVEGFQFFQSVCFRGSLPWMGIKNASFHFFLRDTSSFCDDVL